MNRTYVKKALAVAVILLFIGMSVVPSTAVQELREKPLPINFDGNSLYVGGSGPNNYTTIQDAIDDASDGDTVFVYSGSYHEYIGIISKSISIIGENKNSTIIDFDKPGALVLFRDSHNCYFSGFTLLNVFNEYHGDNNLVRLMESSNNVLSDCILSFHQTEDMFRDSDAIYLEVTSDNNVIANNHLSEPESVRDCIGINIQSINNEICGNFISNYYHGIHIENNENNISDNYITQSLWGVYVKSGYNNTINNNDIVFNEWHGMVIYSSGQRISGNDISYNGLGYVDEGGIKIWFDANENIIENNIISYNNGSGIYYLESYDNYITKNNFINNRADVRFEV